MASLLVIGGSGFFGKSILDAYRRGLLLPWEINRIEVVARKAGNLSAMNPELISKNVFLHDLDIASCTYLPTADYVIHAAASSDARNYLSRPDEEKRNIQLGTSNFCKLAEQYLKNSKILYVSSGAVYGEQPAELELIGEDVDFRPIETLSPDKQDYAAAKRDGESYIKNIGKKGFNVSIARCFAFVGPYLPRNTHFAIGNFIEDGLQRRPINIKAQYKVYRSYLYSDDLVLSLMTILENSSNNCPIFNVGSDEGILITDLAEIIGKIFGVKIECQSINSRKIDRYVPSINKLKKLGYTPESGLLIALESTICRIKSYN